MTERKTTGTKKATTSLNLSNEKVFEEIRKRAYELFCKRGASNGDDMRDWLEAEKQVKRELGMTR
jgi:hypothetical protein